MMFLKNSDSPISTQPRTYPTIDDNYNDLSKETNEKKRENINYWIHRRLFLKKGTY